jgi:hypothetical protein
MSQVLLSQAPARWVEAAAVECFEIVKRSFAMKHVVFGFVVLLLYGCGAETATTAASGAAIKKQEIIEGQKRQDQTRQHVERAMSQTQQRAEKDSER